MKKREPSKPGCARGPVRGLQRAELERVTAGLAAPAVPPVQPDCWSSFD